MFGISAAREPGSEHIEQKITPTVLPAAYLTWRATPAAESRSYSAERLAIERAEGEGMLVPDVEVTTPDSAWNRPITRHLQTLTAAQRR